jgi:hypothetical protein
VEELLQEVKDEDVPAHLREIFAKVYMTSLLECASFILFIIGSGRRRKEAKGKGRISSIYDIKGEIVITTILLNLTCFIS